MSPTKKSVRRTVPSRTAPRKRKAAEPSADVYVWEDDPGAPDQKAPSPVRVPSPDIGRSPYPLSIAGPAPAPRLYAKGSAGFRYWGGAAALRRGADFWGGIVPAGTGWQPGGTLGANLDHGSDLNAYYDRRGLWFFHAAVRGVTVYSGESPDIVCHELGHGRDPSPRHRGRGAPQRPGGRRPGRARGRCPLRPGRRGVCPRRREDQRHDRFRPAGAPGLFCSPRRRNDGRSDGGIRGPGLLVVLVPPRARGPRRARGRRDARRPRARGKPKSWSSAAARWRSSAGLSTAASTALESEVYDQRGKGS